MFSSQNRNLIEEITDKLETHGNNRASLPYILPVLQDVNKADAESGMLFIADKLNIPPVEYLACCRFTKIPMPPLGRCRMSVCVDPCAFIREM
jgi:NADH:ubiquinone oxidoreductase subunit E